MPVYVQRHRGTNRPGASDNTGREYSPPLKNHRACDLVTREDQLIGMAARYLRAHPEGATTRMLAEVLKVHKEELRKALNSELNVMFRTRDGRLGRVWIWGLTWR